MTRFTLPLFIRKHEMIAYAQSGIEFHHKEKDRSEILQLGQIHTILLGYHFFFLILSLYCPQYVICNIHNMKLFTIFLKTDYIITLNNHMH